MPIPNGPRYIAPIDPGGAGQVGVVTVKTEFGSETSVTGAHQAAGCVPAILSFFNGRTKFCWYKYLGCEPTLQSYPEWLGRAVKKCKCWIPREAVSPLPAILF